MSSVPAIKALVSEIGTLCNALLDAVPKASKTDTRPFDPLFGEDCRDSNGRLHHVRQGFPLDFVELKLQHLVTELKHLQYAGRCATSCACHQPCSQNEGRCNPSATTDEFRTRQVQVPHPIKPSFPPLSNFLTTATTTHAKHTISGTDNDSDDGAYNFPKRLKRQNTSSMCSSTKVMKQSFLVISSEDSDDGGGDTMTIPSTLGNRTGVGADDLFADVDVQAEGASAPTRQDKRRDVNQFFHPAVTKEINGKTKKYCVCKLCPNKKSIVDEVTTLRRHLDAMHAGKYRKWAEGEDFTSKLPSDIKRRKAGELEAIRTLDPDLRERVPSTRVAPYSDEAFRRLAIEWLIDTDQPLQAFQHPSFEAMIEMASRASNGVHIPGRKGCAE
ncbi:hypothetical protein BGW80DRAFT_1288254 [Lactifluus volemus]|nr:hypothetical protein BGW80DRAFT_1288254 [Lactifluus volemus]